MIEVRRLSKTYPGSTAKAVDAVDFTVETGRMFTLLGPSGCGKTTTLRCVAGLEKPDTGSISLFDECVFSDSPSRFVAPGKRKIGMVFQSYAIWPHMSVLQNVSYPLRGRGLSGAEMRRRAIEALKMVNLDGLEDRPAPRLSGGQQQRVALARAIASSPRIFLFDEPLSNLDAKLRHEMRSQIRNLQRKIGTTSLYVTHDQLEALSISDQIAVMDGGKIIEVGTPRDIYLHPKSRFAAQFIGQSNLVPAKAIGGDASATIIEAPFGQLSYGHADGGLNLPAGSPLLLLLRPEHINVSLGHVQSLPNSWQGTVVATEFLGDSVDVGIDCSGVSLRVKATAFLPLDPGATVTLNIAPTHFTVVQA